MRPHQSTWTQRDSSSHIPKRGNTSAVTRESVKFTLLCLYFFGLAYRYAISCNTRPREIPSRARTCRVVRRPPSHASSLRCESNSTTTTNLKVMWTLGRNNSTAWVPLQPTLDNESMSRNYRHVVRRRPQAWRRLQTVWWRWSRIVGCEDFRDGNYGGVYKLDLMTGRRFFGNYSLVSIKVTFPRRLTDGSQQPESPDNVSIVPIPMYWELQELINETFKLQARLDENSWKHGCGKELCSVISKCVRYSKHTSNYFAVW